MANQYDTNLKLQAIADAIGDSSSSGLISALEDIADAVAGGGGGGSSTAGLVSDNFSETDTYDLGDYCIHNNTLYVCINAITTPGPWDLSDWQATNAGIELSSLNSALEVKDLSANVTLDTYGRSLGSSTFYRIGNIVIVNLDVNIAASTPVNGAVLQGLPIPLNNGRAFTGGAKADGGAIRINVTAGKVVAADANNSAVWVSASFSYVAA